MSSMSVMRRMRVGRSYVPIISGGKSVLISKKFMCESGRKTKARRLKGARWTAGDSGIEYSHFFLYRSLTGERIRLTITYNGEKENWKNKHFFVVIADGHPKSSEREYGLFGFAKVVNVALCLAMSARNDKSQKTVLLWANLLQLSDRSRLIRLHSYVLLFFGAVLILFWERPDILGFFGGGGRSSQLSND